MKNFTSFLGSGLLCLMLLSGARAQGIGASGDIKGTVTDPNGAVLQNVNLTAVGTQTGLRRTAVTDGSGQYRISSLPPSIYDVSAELSGFETAVQKGITVSVGETVTLDFHMKVGQIGEKVDVTTEPPVVDTERGSQANSVSERYIRDLPINRRDYLTYTLLMPGVVDSTRVASDQDFRVKQTPQSGLSFYGSNGRGNSVTLDGGEINDDAGGVRLNLSQDAVQEFQINRSNYSAELGGASGAAINIVSKAGSNDTHGSAYGFFRFTGLDARNPFSINQALQPGQTFDPTAPDLQGVPVKDTLNRQQFGGTVGFAIKKDKTFAFISLEGLIQNAQTAVPLLTNTNIFRPNAAQQAVIGGLTGTTVVPCLSGPVGAAVAQKLHLPPPNPTTNLPAAACGAILNGTLTVNPAASALNAFLVNQFVINGGLFPYNTRQYLVSGRVDHKFSDHHQFFLRYNFGHDREENPDVQSLTGFSRGSSIHAVENNIEGSSFYQFSARTQNEARVQFAATTFDVIPNVPGQVGLDIPGFGNFGTQIFLPNLTRTRRFEFADNLTMMRGHHTFKVGGAGLIRHNDTESHTFFPGRFVFGNLPGNLLSPLLPGLNSLQSASFGLPQFYQQGFDNPFYLANRPLVAFYGEDSWAVRPNFTLNYGLRYELDVQYGNLSTDKDNFAPRLSFAWDPFKDHKTAVRGGFGIFHSQVYAQIPNVVQTLGIVDGFRQIAQVFVPLTGVPGSPPSLNSAAIFQTLFAQGKVQCTTPAAGQDACITPADLTQFGITITHTGAIPPLTVIFSGQPDFQNPYSLQGEFGVEREIARNLSVSASYIYVHTLHLPVALDINNLQILNLPLAQQFVPAGPAGILIRSWNSSIAPNPNCAGAKVFNCFVNPLILQGNQYSSAGAAIYHAGIFEARKRFSKGVAIFANYTISKAIDQVTDFNSDYGPNDHTCLGCERSLSTFDQRHKLAFAAVLDSPWKGFLSGFQLSMIVRNNSGHPFNLLAGADVNGDHHSTTDRPPGAGRNTGHGPNYADLDMRLTREIRLSENVRLHLLIEGFNLFNRTNFGSVNNVVGVIGPPFDLTGNSAVSPSQPLGFTSALPKRQFQIGARLTF